MECPACHELMTIQTFKNFERSTCGTCGNFWIRKGQLSAAIDSADSIDQNASQEQNPDKAEPSMSVARHCPECSEELTEYHYAHDSGVIVRRCKQGCGFWLWPGQLVELNRSRAGSERQNLLAQAMKEELDRRNELGLYVRLVKSRILVCIAWAALIGGTYLVTQSIEAVFITILRSLIAFCLIFFADTFGQFLGRSSTVLRARAQESIPAVALALGGWFWLGSLFFVLALRWKAGV